MIPLIRPLIPDSAVALRYFQRAQERGIYSNFGTLHEDLERRLTALTAGYAVPCSSGTLAIEFALRTLGLDDGAKVLVPDFTHTGTVLAVVRAGLTPVLAGVDPMTWILRPDEVEAAWIGQKIEAAIVVDPFGYGCDSHMWDSLQQRTGVPIVFDMAGAFGSFSGTFSPRCFSFHATKNFGVGEGGMMVFHDGGSAHRAKRLLNFDTLPDRSIASLNGCNGKVDELHCAWLLAALDDMAKVKLRIDAKRHLIRFYKSNIPGSFHPRHAPANPSLCVLSGLPARDLERISGTGHFGPVFRRYYPLLSSMPALKDIERLSVSDEVMETCCALPSDVSLSEAYQVVAVVNKHL